MGTTAIVIIVILAALIFGTLSFLSTPKGRGILGEAYIRFIIGKTKEGKRYVINNYMIVDEGKSSQIDHILINKTGIFVIETKNYSGRIYGEDNQQEWTQVLNYGKVKNHFYNPVKQNATHIYRLAKVLPKDAPLISVVVFTKDNVQYIKSEHVIASVKLGHFVKTENGKNLSAETMSQYYKSILDNRATLSNKEHVAEIKQMKQNIDENICPRCGGKLVERNGKYGKFYGCENYPQCKFIKK